MMRAGPALKRQVRFATNFLSAARQMEVVSGVTARQVNRPTTRPSPPVGDSWTDSMEGAIGVATHHDGMVRPVHGTGVRVRYTHARTHTRTHAHTHTHTHMGPQG
jgi:hypothetical protein